MLNSKYNIVQYGFFRVIFFCEILLYFLKGTIFRNIFCWENDKIINVVNKFLYFS